MVNVVWEVEPDTMIKFSNIQNKEAMHNRWKIDFGDSSYLNLHQSEVPVVMLVVIMGLPIITTAPLAHPHQ